MVKVKACNCKDSQGNACNCHIFIRVQLYDTPNQNGFRPGRTKTSHVLGLRRLIEGVKEFNKKPIIIYVDFKKAFDSINRKVMIKILKAYGIPNCLVNVIALFYENTRARVITPDGNIDSFVIKKGVLQSDTLAPYLFVIMIDFVMRNVYNGKEENLGFTLKRRMSRRHPAEVITDLDFADDLALLTQ